MSRRTYPVILAACLPAGVLLNVASHGNRLSEAVVVIGALSSAAGGWYGTKTAIEQHGIPVTSGQSPEPGPGRRRAASTTGTMAVRSAVGPDAVDEPYRGAADPEPEQEQLPAGPAAAATASTTLTPPLSDLPPRIGPDPYVYWPDSEDTQVMAALADEEPSDEQLVAACAWHASSGTAHSYWTADGQDLYFGDRALVTP